MFPTFLPISFLSTLSQQVLLVQTFRDPPDGFGAATVDELCSLASTAIASSATAAAVPSIDLDPMGAASLSPVWNDRRKKTRWHGRQHDERSVDSGVANGDGGGGGSSVVDGSRWGGSNRNRESVEREDRRMYVSSDDHGEWQRSGVTVSREPEVLPPLPPHRLSSEYEPSSSALGVKVGDWSRWFVL